MKTIKLDNIPVEVALLIKKMESLDKDEERLNDESAKINSKRRKVEEELREVCNHPKELVVVKRRWDPGDPGKTTGSRWDEQYCELCHSVLAVRGDRSSDEWREMPKGSVSGSYGVYTPNGGVYTH